MDYDFKISIGEKLSPVLSEIEDTLWEYEAQNLGNPKFTDIVFRSAIKIMMCVLLDKMWELQEKEDMDLSIRATMAGKAGNDFKNLIKTYTNIDTHKMYK